MSDRKLLEPNRAMAQTLAGLRSGVTRGQNRQRWPGAIQRTLIEGAAAATTNLTQVTIAALDLEPGVWSILGRAGVQISSTPGVPTYSGTEVFTIVLNILERDSTVILEQLDIDFWCPATTQFAFTSGFYADSKMLFGSINYDVQTTAVIVGYSDDTDAADHIVPWRAGKLIALPF